MVGANIRRIRTGQGVMAKYVAENLGVSTVTYAGIEAGTVDPRWSWLVRIAQILRVPLSDILEDETRPDDARAAI